MKLTYIRDAEVPGEPHIKLEGTKEYASIGASCVHRGRYYINASCSLANLYAQTTFEAIELGLKLIEDAEKNFAR